MTNDLRIKLLEIFKTKVEKEQIITSAKIDAVNTADAVYHKLLDDIFNQYSESSDEEIKSVSRLFTIAEVEEESYPCDSTILEWLKVHPNESYYFYLQWGEHFVLIDYNNLIERFSKDKEDLDLKYGIELIDGKTYFIVTVQRGKIKTAINALSGFIK